MSAYDLSDRTFRRQGVTVKGVAYELDSIEWLIRTFMTPTRVALPIVKPSRHLPVDLAECSHMYIICDVRSGSAYERAALVELVEIHKSALTPKAAKVSLVDRLRMMCGRLAWR